MSEEYETISEYDLEHASVVGASIKSIQAALRKGSPVFEKKVNEMLEENGLENPKEIDSTTRYSLAPSIKTLYDIEDDMGPRTIRQAGRTVPEEVEWPEEVEEPLDAIAATGEAYNETHSGDVGFYEVEAQGDGEVKVTAQNPYPCEFEKGLLKGIPGHLGDGVSSSQVRVEHSSDECRAEGDDICEYTVTW